MVINQKDLSRLEQRSVLKGFCEIYGRMCDVYREAYFRQKNSLCQKDNLLSGYLVRCQLTIHGVDTGWDVTWQSMEWIICEVSIDNPWSVWFVKCHMTIHGRDIFCGFTWQSMEWILSEVSIDSPWSGYLVRCHMTMPKIYSHALFFCSPPLTQEQ